MTEAVSANSEEKRIRVTWVKNGLRSEKLFTDMNEASEYMTKLEKSEAMYFWDWCE